MNSDSKKIEIIVMEVSQNIGVFYIGKISPSILKRISRKDLSRYKNAQDGIQRDVNQKRKTEIEKYIYGNKDSTFPNSIIISIESNISSEKQNYIIEDIDSKNGIYKLIIEDTDDIASVLDGQHRLSGFRDDEKDFELPVSIFLDPSLSTQAKIFAKINGTQIKVSSDLVYDLYGITEGRSPEKTAYSIVKHLNEDEDSVWFDQIKTLSERHGYLSQGSFAKYIHKELIDEKKYLNNMYIEGRDSDLLKMLKNFFKAIAIEFGVLWNSKEQNLILQKTTGFVALMLLFKDIVETARSEKIPITFEFVQDKIVGMSSKFTNEMLTSDHFESGGVGQKALYREFKSTLDSKIS